MLRSLRRTFSLQTFATSCSFRIGSNSNNLSHFEIFNYILLTLFVSVVGTAEPLKKVLKIFMNEKSTKAQRPIQDLK